MTDPNEETQEMEAITDEDLHEGWPHDCHDMSDDADALASIGWGTDEDYGYYGDDF
jgi:hypothetical protein